ncbi:MAG: hypothetical protein HQL24_01035 [Candidatus Omnitrophica bacterium]|nr:hypothetical protein [Candidatus Omnitrophota bacterium]
MLKRHLKGQSITEYVLIFAAVSIVILMALAPKHGFVTKAIDNSLNISVSAIENMVQTVKYNIDLQ